MAWLACKKQLDLAFGFVDELLSVFLFWFQWLFQNWLQPRTLHGPQTQRFTGSNFWGLHLQGMPSPHKRWPHTFWCVFACQTLPKYYDAEKLKNSVYNLPLVRFFEVEKRCWVKGLRFFGWKPCGVKPWEKPFLGKAFSPVTWCNASSGFQPGWKNKHSRVWRLQAFYAGRVPPGWIYTTLCEFPKVIQKAEYCVNILWVASIKKHGATPCSSK